MELEEEQVETWFRHCGNCTSTRVRCNCSSCNSWTHSTGKSMDTQIEVLRIDLNRFGVFFESDLLQDLVAVCVFQTDLKHQHQKYCHAKHYLAGNPHWIRA
ncbi:hypothetical protein Mapa_006195 [Marchantia paleacea]|nr:hypothetical protein Mapa_006195 [Marchantia paleacea]